MPFGSVTPFLGSTFGETSSYQCRLDSTTSWRPSGQQVKPYTASFAIIHNKLPIKELNNTFALARNSGNIGLILDKEEALKNLVNQICRQELSSNHSCFVFPFKNRWYTFYIFMLIFLNIHYCLCKFFIQKYIFLILFPMVTSVKWDYQARI